MVAVSRQRGGCLAVRLEPDRCREPSASGGDKRRFVAAWGYGRPTPIGCLGSALHALDEDVEVLLVDARSAPDREGHGADLASGDELVDRVGRLVAKDLGGLAHGEEPRLDVGLARLLHQITSPVTSAISATRAVSATATRRQPIGFGPSFRRRVQVGSYEFTTQTVRPVTRTAQGPLRTFLGPSGSKGGYCGVTGSWLNVAHMNPYEPR